MKNRMWSIGLLGVGTIVLAGCAASGPRLPEPEPIDPNKIEKPKDWENWGGTQGSTSTPTPIQTDPNAERLTGEQIVATFRGKVLRGCYPNGTAFAETLAQNGKFYDAQNNNAELGEWGVANDQLCFRYPERAAQNQPDSCFAVVKSGARYDFYLPDGSAKVASTACN